MPINTHNFKNVTFKFKQFMIWTTELPMDTKVRQHNQVEAIQYGKYSTVWND